MRIRYSFGQGGVPALRMVKCPVVSAPHIQASARHTNKLAPRPTPSRPKRSPLLTSSCFPRAAYLP